MSDRPQLEFWYEFASTYSYLAAARIETLASDSGVMISYRPFLLGPIFGANGWTTSPFNIFEAKGRNMWRDMERLTARYGLPFRKPDEFPQNGLKAARISLALPDGDRRGAFARKVYDANFGRNEAIADDAVLRRILLDLREEADALLAVVGTPQIKDALKANSAKAAAKGLFGAPSFVCADGELFWGNDRLEQALEWAQSPGLDS